MMTPDERQDMERGKLTVPTKEQILLTGGTLLTTGVIDLAAHAGGTGAVVGLLATFVIARHSKDILDCGHTFIKALVPGSDAPRVVEVTEQVVERIALSEQHQDQATLSKLRRLVGLKGQGMQRDGEVKTEPETEPLPKVTSTTQDEGSTQPSSIPGQFRLGNQTLVAMKQLNSQGRVYFGATLTGAATLRIDEMYHVLDVAKSGRGKSNRFRHAMMQVVDMADTYYLNPFAAPVKSVTDKRQIEVWQPIFDRLANRHPVRESGEILEVLMGLIREIEVRSDQEQERDFSWRQHPIFVFIDEVPEINARCPDAVKLLDRIGRGGRQFGIFAWIASQTALVQDIGLSTASQAQFKTLLYGGGDKTSGNRVLGSVTPEQEKSLKTNGAGLTIMLADGIDTEYVRAPLVTNEALFAYLGLPPFQIDEWLAPVRSKQSVQRLATSEASSVPTSDRRSNFHLIDSREAAKEVDRSGFSRSEVAEVERWQLSEREMQIAKMFFELRMNPGAIARELSGGKGGDAFQKISLEVADAIRKYVEVQRGA